MQPISFTNGSRIFTPTYPAQSQQVELTDLNGDGEIDILDASLIVSNPGGIPSVDPPPFEVPTISLTDNLDVVNKFVEPQYCINDGIIVTGCNSIYNADGTINLPDGPIPSLFCEGQKVRGFAYVPEVNGLRWIDECTCPEDKSNVNATDIAAIFIGGTTKNAAKKTAKEALIRARAAAEDNLKNAIDYRKLLDDALKAIIDAMKQYEKNAKDLEKAISDLKKAALTGVHPVTGKPIPPGMAPKIPAALQKLEKELAAVNASLSRDAQSLITIKNEMAHFDSLIANYKAAKDQAKQLLDDLDHFDPARWVSALIPLTQFFVAKFCGEGAELNDECECVPRSSGSYSSSYTNNIAIPSGYNLIESL